MSTTTDYTIYLENDSSSTQVFWCFLERPVELASDPKVFANSEVRLAVAPHSGDVNTFTIPVQYVTGAGASNHAVGLDVRIDSTISQKAELNDKFSATYANVPPPMGPRLKKSGTGAGQNNISISSNPFDKPNNEANGWFSSMSFGIRTDQGFTGMTWSPDPNQTRTLTPKLSFYVAVGTYGANRLADWTTISNSSAKLTVPSSFEDRKATVTYTPEGEWVVTPGKPDGAKSQAAMQEQLANLANDDPSFLEEVFGKLVGR